MDYKGLVAGVMESLCSSCWQPSLLKPFILNLHIIPLYTRILPLAHTHVEDRQIR
jgi:hypothetical protein